MSEVGLQGFVCPKNLSNTDFDFCVTMCEDRCHPLPLLFALMDNREVVPNVYSVTEILNPPQIVYLKRNNPYYNTIESLIWMTFGRAWHRVVETQLDKRFTDEMQEKHIVEQGFEVDINGITLTGRADYYDAETKTLWDYKTMKVYPVKKLMAGEWDDTTYHKQLNIYRVYGFPDAEHLKIEAVIKDWSPLALKKDKIKPLETIDVLMIPDVQVIRGTEKLIKEHTENQKDPSKVRPCKVPEETWLQMNPRSPNFKVHQRCRDYCPVSGICPQYRKILGG